MAQRTIVSLLDDLDGSEAAETVTFGLDGKNYEIDLSEENAGKLREFLAPYVERGRRAGRRGRRGGGVGTHWTAPSPGRGREMGEVRSWARENGYPVNERGRIPRHVLEAYEAAH